MTPAQREHLEVLKTTRWNRPMSSESVARSLRERRYGWGYAGTFGAGRRGTGSATRVLRGLEKLGFVSVKVGPHVSGVAYLWMLTDEGRAQIP